MPKTGRQWVWAPNKPSVVPVALKEEVSAKGDKLVQEYIKPTYVEPPSKKPRFNYLVDAHTKWRGRYYYFISKYANPRPNRLAPFFYVGFARMEYAGDRRFNLAYFRHTGKWWQVNSNLSLREALDLIRKDSLFHP